VALFFGLQGKSSENGSFLEFGWRLLGMFGPKSSNIGLQRLLAFDGPFSSEEGNSLKRTLAGWRRSADRTSLQENSLVSGNFTGNFAILGPRDTI
jgi:hypothetical protein